MNWQTNPYAVAAIISSVVSIPIAIYGWRRRATPGALPIALFMLAAAEWSLAYALELGSTTLEAKIFWSKLQYLGIVAVAPLLLLFVIEYLGRERWLTRRNLLLLTTVPILGLLLVWTNEAHGLIWKDLGLVPGSSFPMLDVKAYGAFFWVIFLYSYLCLFWGTLLLVRAFRRSPRLYRSQTGITLAGMFVPWIANALYVFKLTYVDLTPLAFTASGLAAAWGLFRYQLLEVVPIARYTVMEGMDDGVIVLDAQGRIVDINPFAQQLIGRTASEVIGQSAGQILARWPELVERYRDVTDAHTQIALDEGESQRFFDIRISPLHDRRGELTGRVIVVHDTTEFKQTEMALREHQHRLETQNEELRKLSLAVEQSANIVIITDLEGRIEYVNPRFEKATGYTADEVLGRNTRLLKSGEQSKQFYQDLWRTITAGQEWQGEFHNKRKDGTLYWEQAIITPALDEAGQPTHFIAVKEDITARREAEEALSKLLELSRVLAASRDMDVALAQAVNSAVEIVPAADRGTLQWLDDKGEILYTVAFSNTSDVPKNVPSFRPGVGVAGHALKTKQCINVPDVLEDQRFIPGDPSVSFRSLLVAPLIVKERALGTLSLSSVRVGAFSSTDETLIGLMADQIAAALENAYDLTARKRAEENLQRLTERLRILHEIDQSILAARLPETIAVGAIRRIRQLIPCQRALVIAAEEPDQLRLLAAESSGKMGARADIELYQELFQERTLTRGWVQGVEDLAARPQLSRLQKSLYAEGVRSYIAVPLFIQDELVGSLNFETDQPRAFTADHIAIATEVAASLAVAIRQVQLFEQAQQEIAERTKAEETLRQYTAALEAQNAELDAFAHTVAHDLKNPVSSITGYAEVLGERRSTLPDKLIDKYLGAITRSGHKMSTIIDELLLLSSVREKEDIETGPLKMGRIVAEAKGRLLHVLEELQGEITMPDAWPGVIGHAPWIEAVWANYISNALKYGGRPPRVELGATIQEDNYVRFWVHDNGDGLLPEEQASLFTPFERVHQVRIEGHGLGLSIVQRIVHKLGGQVGVESEGIPGQGSTFYFTLPGLPPDK
jgi:PAS domain S-box-containing protein